MKQIKIILIFAVLSLDFMASAQAAIEAYQFDDKQKAARFQQLTAELRCPKCQNQNIADSNAEIAHDLRSKIEQMLVADKSNDEIVQYMLERYGDFVLYKPRITAQTYLLWYGPAALLIMALIIVFFIVRGRSQRSAKVEGAALNSDQQKRLNSLLDKQQDTE